jgi:hypothetical protein
MRWLTASLLIPVFYGLMSIYFAFSHPYIVQDDARQHLVWLQRFVDSQLFPQDVIADYYRTIAPPGFTAFYALFAKLGIAPLILAKILPLFLGIITTFYGFKLFLEIFPVPFAACIGSLILNQTVWLKDDLVSASPRAFLYPIFAAFLYYLSRRSLIPCLVTTALQALFFPQMVLIYLAMFTVRLFRWRDRSLQLSTDRQDYLLWGLGIAIALPILLFSYLRLAQFDTAFTVAQMQTMPEFGTQGRTRYFGVSAFDFVMNGNSGIRPPLLPPIVWSSLGLFFLKLRRMLKLEILGQLLIASFSMFLVAHWLMPRLYYPNRYTYHSLRFVMAIGAGIVLFSWLKSGREWLRHKRQSQTSFSLRESLLTGFAGLFIVATIVIPAAPPLVFLMESWNVGHHPALYQFLAAQPKDILVASLDPDADNIPAFTERSVFVSGEFAFAFHVKYYSEMRDRAAATLRAQYGDLADVQQFIQRYGIDFWLVSKNFLQPDYLLNQVWLVNSSFRAEVFETAERLQQEEKPALAGLLDQCAVSTTETLILLDAKCLQKPLSTHHNEKLYDRKTETNL